MHTFEVLATAKYYKPYMTVNKNEQVYHVKFSVLVTIPQSYQVLYRDVLTFDCYSN